MSCVTCHMSRVTFFLLFFFLDNVVELICGGSVINGATLSSFLMFRLFWPYWRFLTNWLFLAIFDRFWPFFYHIDRCWPLFTVVERFELFLTIFDGFGWYWLLLTIFDHFWPFLTVFFFPFWPFLTFLVQYHTCMRGPSVTCMWGFSFYKSKQICPF